jgi:hypothetical protein
MQIILQYKHSSQVKAEDLCGDDHNTRRTLSGLQLGVEWNGTSHFCSQMPLLGRIECEIQPSILWLFSGAKMGKKSEMAPIANGTVCRPCIQNH